MGNKGILVGIVVLVAIVAGFIFLNSGNTDSAPITGNAVAGEIQKVTLGVKDYNYFPNTVNVKAGSPVEITLDKSVTGCLRSFTIKDLGVSQYAKTPDQKIVFTPTQKGSFRFACSMGMGYGTIVVE
jgi:plastocyanin domain-containing protein